MVELAKPEASPSSNQVKQLKRRVRLLLDPTMTTRCNGVITRRGRSANNH